MADRPRCPECGLYLPDAAFQDSHRCGVPLLIEAAGIVLTDQQRRYIRWLAGWDRETVDVVCQIFRGIRAAHASPEPDA